MSSDPYSSGVHWPTLSYYEANAPRFFEETRDVNMSPLYEPFLSRPRSGAHILDAGCGSGRDSLYFLDNGYDVTSFDASEAMVRLAAKHLGQPVLRLVFDQVGFEEHFDGVWACASLLHVPRRAMARTLGRLASSLKRGGTLYASFRYGNGEVIRNGRLFTDYTEEGFEALLGVLPDLELVRTWRTADLRPEHADTTWLNTLSRRR